MACTTMRRVLVVGALASLALPTAACGGTTKDSGSATGGGDIVLGSSLSLTGPLGQFGVDLKAGYEQQVADVNAGGGLKVGASKRKVTLKVLDNRSDPNTATQQVRELILKDGAVALLGACTPPIVTPEALAAEKQRVPIVSSCNPVRAFQAGSSSGWRYAWDLFFDEGEQATTVAKGMLLTSSNKKVAVFTDTEPDGVAERGLYKDAFTAAGLDVVGDYSFPVGTTDFSSFINDAKGKGAQLVAGQMVPPDGIALWKQMKSLALSPSLAFVAKAATSAAWPQGLADVAEGTLTEGFWSPTNGNKGSDQVNKTLGQKFSDSFADLNIAVLAYTVSAIVTDGIAAAGSTDADKVNAAIGKTNAEYPLGQVSFNAKHTATTPYLLMQWQEGKLVQILPTVQGVTVQAPAKGLASG